MPQSSAGVEDGEVVGALWGGSHFSGTHGGHREAHQTTYRDPQKHLKPRPFQTTYLKPRPLVIKQDYDNENKNNKDNNKNDVHHLQRPTEAGEGVWKDAKDSKVSWL